MKVTKILLPVDGSEHSNHAAEMAIELSKSTGAPIVLLYVRKTVPSGLGQPNADDYLQELTSGAKLIIEPYTWKLDEAGIEFEEFVIGGNVAEVIANVARVEKCDLILIGSKGKSELEGLILGSVTHKVLHTAECPVMVVK